MNTNFIKPLMLSAALALTAGALTPIPAFADDTMMSAGAMASESTVMVGGAAMYPSKNIIENAVNSKDHTTLVAAVKAADLVDALSGKGPFTVFAPVNAAFTALPAGTVETLLKPENKDQLTKILTAHVVAGDISAQDLMTKGKDKNGYAMKTLSGDVLVAFNRGGYVYIVDENGGSAKVTISDVNQSNGVIHVVNKVLLPK
ncbi:fasciclin domain-containing protein [Mariluticola halotolerans]|uniref:fasciclin domain-containing protein n=1 Tax=Mariluticola halotolerans TaxID=2909283 RepID=UPI003F62B2CD